MTKKQRAILLSVVTLMLCLALVAGGTYALFTAEARFTNHLQAGELKVKLERTKLKSFELDPNTGYMMNVENTETVDFTNATAANVFGVTGNALIAPCSEYTATMRITNNGSVAFGYWLQIIFKDGENGDPITQAQLDAMDLDEQIEVKLNDQSIILSDGLTIRGENGGDYVGQLAKAATDDGAGNLSHNLPSSAEFTISIKFLDDRTNSTIGKNNDAMNESLWFDLIIHAVQIPDTAPTQSTP